MGIQDLSTASQLLVVTVLLIIVRAVINSISTRRKPPFAPGPNPRFLIGNLFDVPIVDPAQTYIAWGKKYNSDILHATVFGRHIVVLNSLKHAEELLEKRASQFSDRPRSPIITMMGWDKAMPFMQIGDEWRRHRRLAQQNFRKNAVVQYHPIQLKKVHTMLRGLLDSPDLFDDHNKMFSVSVPMSIMYGQDLKNPSDPHIIAAEEMTTLGFTLLQPGYTLISILPFLRHIPRWFPGATAHRMAHETKILSERLTSSPIEMVKKAMKEGTARQSIALKYMEGENRSPVNEDIIAGLGFTGASDTTVSATRTLFYLLVNHPEVQRRAQKELDSVVGSDRLPTFEDRPYMPYIEAIYLEVLRWRPPIMLGLPHVSTEDTVYEGYYIPKGTLVFANIWGMAHDENIYTDPMSFRPERFLTPDGQLKDDTRVYAYGFGRRGCVGNHLASDSMWIAIASLLATFTILKAKDANGHDVEVPEDFDDTGVITHKKPFKCQIEPRSETARKLVQETTL